ncbi:MAG: cytochrome c-type biosis protein [Patescibacteria group bacterium]|nr:cytochrome c-type biosis protein [Patescibacteria group bacterium]
MEFAFLVSSFLAGVLMFLAPCTLPLVPGFLSFVGGEDKRKTIVNTLFFILGFSLVFIGFGVLVSFLGESLVIFRNTLSFLGGVLIIFFGLYILRFFRIPLLERSFKIFNFGKLKPHTKSGSFILGVSFASGWTPCVGPILASILLIAANTDTVLVGTFLLFVFSLGLAIPFLVTAILSRRINNIIQRINKNDWVYKIGGLLLVFIGFLLVTNNFYLFTRWGFQLLDFIGYDKILNLL